MYASAMFGLCELEALSFKGTHEQASFMTPRFIGRSKVGPTNPVQLFSVICCSSCPQEDGHPVRPPAPR